MGPVSTERRVRSHRATHMNLIFAYYSSTKEIVPDLLQGTEVFEQGFLIEIQLIGILEVFLLSLIINRCVWGSQGGVTGSLRCPYPPRVPTGSRCVGARNRGRRHLNITTDYSTNLLRLSTNLCDLCVEDGCLFWEAVG